MASPKRRKLEKTPPPEPVGGQRFSCCRCGTAYGRQKGAFPVSHSPMYRGTGYLPICGDCIDDMYEQYRTILADDKEAMRRMCMKMDLYWSDQIYESVLRTAGVHSRIKTYITKTNQIKYIDKTYDDTLVEEARKTETERLANAFLFKEDVLSDGLSGSSGKVTSSDVDQETIDFWGSGFDAKEYAELDRRYKAWTKNKDSLEINEISFYRQICYLELSIARDMAAGKSVDKSQNTYNTLLGSMNLKPVQNSEDADAELEGMPLGVGIQKWETMRPLPETPKKLQDMSQTIRNISIWYLGHACKMVGLKNSYSRMYEEEMEKLRVKRPEYDEEDDDTFLNDIFGSSGGTT